MKRRQHTRCAPSRHSVATLPRIGDSSITTFASADRTYWLVSLRSSEMQGSTAAITCKGQQARRSGVTLPLPAWAAAASVARAGRATLRTGPLRATRLGSREQPAYLGQLAGRSCSDFRLAISEQLAEAGQQSRAGHARIQAFGEAGQLLGDVVAHTPRLVLRPPGAQRSDAALPVGTRGQGHAGRR